MDFYLAIQAKIWIWTIQGSDRFAPSVQRINHDSDPHWLVVSRCDDTLNLMPLLILAW